MSFEAQLIAGLITIGLAVTFMGGFGWFVYKDSHRKPDQKDS